MSSDIGASIAHARHLSDSQLKVLTLAWELWAKNTESIPRAIGRARMHLIFLLIRYGGLRLGETFKLNPRLDIDTHTGIVSIQGEHRRQVLLPMAPMRHIRLIIALEEAGEPDFLRRDPGFCRLTFYSVAKNAGVPQHLAGPRAVRKARKHELLRLHMPLKVVHEYLGLPRPHNGVLS